MRRPRLRYSLLTLLAVVAASAFIMGALRATERERLRRSLAGVRLTAALKNCQRQLTRFNGGMIPLEPVYIWSLRVMEAERDRARTSGERLAAVEAHRARMEAIQRAFEVMEKKFDGKFCPNIDEIEALDYCINEATYWCATDQ
jgi:hypothetical protein